MTGRKTTFYAQAPDNTVLKRTSDKRIYTHAVLIRVHPRTSKIQEFGYGEPDKTKPAFWTAWRWSQSAANADKGVATLYSQPTYYQVEEVLVVEASTTWPEPKQLFMLPFECPRCTNGLVDLFRDVGATDDDLMCRSCGAVFCGLGLHHRGWVPPYDVKNKFHNQPGIADLTAFGWRFLVMPVEKPNGKVSYYGVEIWHQLLGKSPADMKPERDRIYRAQRSPGGPSYDQVQAETIEEAAAQATLWIAKHKAQYGQ